jgi:DNA-binding transcriptional regulator YbjK
LQAALKTVKAELEDRTQELADVQDELASLQTSSAEREKTLKAKYRAAKEEAARLADVEVGAVKLDPALYLSGENPCWFLSLHWLMDW